jgi:hypothetical protein
MLSGEDCYRVFNKSIQDYHRYDDVDQPAKNPFADGSFQALLYQKNWIDTVQWHLEDMIRKPDLNPYDGMAVKRRIDRSNQERTDTVESMDDYFLAQFKAIISKPSARINSETPAWLLDRMSILMLKIYHMEEQTNRKDASRDHVQRCAEKLTLLLEQKNDMRTAFDQLIQDIEEGNRTFKVYRQVKMYNDASLNPMLYNRPETQK